MRTVYTLHVVSTARQDSPVQTAIPGETGQEVARLSQEILTRK